MKVKDRIEWIIDWCKEKDVLDIGCVGIKAKHGHPEWLHGILKKHARSVLGIDNNKLEIRALRRLGYDVRFADAENFSLKKRFDVVLASELIEHLSSPGKFLECVKRHLRKEGYLLLTTPNARHPHMWLLQKWNPDHVQLYNLGILSNLLRRHGFKIVSSCPLADKPRTIKGKIYKELFLRLFPNFSLYLGICAKLN